MGDEFMNARAARPLARLVLVFGAGCALASAGALTGCNRNSGSRDIVLTGVRPAGERLAEAQSLAQRAQARVKRERYDEAIELYRDALRAYDDFPAAWNNLGVLLMEQERYLEAADAFASASERAPSDPRPTFNLGLTWERASYLDEALDHYRRALDRDPRYLPAIRGAIRAEQALGVTNDASADRVRTALLIERDPVWRAYFEQQRIRVEAEMRRKGRDTVLGTD
jgi:tetratricopeptide (TPR) repeat protein